MNKKFLAIAILLAIVFGSVLLHADRALDPILNDFQREVQNLENLVNRIIRAGRITQNDMRDLGNIESAMNQLAARFNNRNLGTPTEQQQRRLNDLELRGRSAVERLWRSGLTPP